MIGEDAEHCRVDIKIMTGLVGPREELAIPLDMVWTAEVHMPKLVIFLCKVMCNSL